MSYWLEEEDAFQELPTELLHHTTSQKRERRDVSADSQFLCCICSQDISIQSTSISRILYCTLVEWVNFNEMIILICVWFVLKMSVQERKGSRITLGSTKIGCIGHTVNQLNPSISSMIPWILPKLSITQNRVLQSDQWFQYLNQELPCLSQTQRHFKLRLQSPSHKLKSWFRTQFL